MSLLCSCCFLRGFFAGLFIPVIYLSALSGFLCSFIVSGLVNSRVYYFFCKFIISVSGCLPMQVQTVLVIDSSFLFQISFLSTSSLEC